MSLINVPPISEEAGSPAWRAWHMAVFRAASALYESGTTANRPTEGLWIGRPYFDTTLGIPIWYDANVGTGWCDATGASV